MNDLPKVAFSKTLPAAGWPGTRIARGDLTEEIAALKGEPGGEIMAHGGAAFVQALSRHGLIDEYRMVILPVALGGGLPSDSQTILAICPRVALLNGRKV